MDGYVEACRDMIGVGSENWVPTEHYEEAVARGKGMKDLGLAAVEEEEERAGPAAQWPCDDMDEEDHV